LTNSVFKREDRIIKTGVFSLDKKVAIVTGGADGLGKAIAKQYLEHGFNVAAFDINELALRATAAEFQSIGDFLPVTTNVVEEEILIQSVQAVYERFGRIDVLVNNAGGSMAISQAIEKIDANDWDKVVNLNLRSTFLCSKAVIPYMKKNNWGRIINMSSMAGRSRSVFGGTPYAAAKAGIIGFTRQASKELGPFGITINAVAPGTIISGARISDYWHNKKTEEERNGFIQANPMGRPGVPEDVAGVVYFLGTQEAGYITGAVIDVNGGHWVG